MPGKIADATLAEKGELKHRWAAARMAIIGKIVAKHEKSRPLAGLRLGFCLHVTKETSVLVAAAQALGARVAICSANPLSAQDDIAAFLYSHGTGVYAWRGETKAEYEQCIREVIRSKPEIVTDDGGDLHIAAHTSRAKHIVGGTEETTSGVKRLAALERTGRLAYPVIAVNE
ncbi:MAG: adenosylhomocysteinase, partial [Nitrososphaera sp.]